MWMLVGNMWSVEGEGPLRGFCYNIFPHLFDVTPFAHFLYSYKFIDRLISKLWIKIFIMCWNYMGPRTLHISIILRMLENVELSFACEVVSKKNWWQNFHLQPTKFGSISLVKKYIIYFFSFLFVASRIRK